MQVNTWGDAVFLDYVGVEGKALSEALADYATESGAHDGGDDEPCYCYYCQVWVPMALKLERMLGASDA